MNTATINLPDGRIVLFHNPSEKNDDAHDHNCRTPARI